MTTDVHLLMLLPVFGFLPILLFLFLTLKVPNEDNFSILSFLIEEDKLSIIKATIFKDSDLGRPISFFIELDFLIFTLL